MKKIQLILIMSGMWISGFLVGVGQSENFLKLLEFIFNN